MKPRKQGESDAAYIQRLESANDSLRAENRRLWDENKKFVTHGRVAASQAGAILNMAAEACGVSDDAAVKSARTTLDALAGLPWSEIPQTITSLEIPFVEALGARGDAEMVVRSAYELVVHTAYDPCFFMSILKGAKPKDRDLVMGMIQNLADLARANVSDQIKCVTGIDFSRPTAPAPEVHTLEDARALINDTWFEISDVLSDVAISQALLRLDLRAGMYDSAFRRISKIMRRAGNAVDRLPLRDEYEDDAIPF